MRQQGLRPVVITYYKALTSACGEGRITEGALQLFAEMQQQGLGPY